MRNLIYVNMMRLKKSRIFRAGVAVSMAYVAFLLFMNYQEAADTPETVIRQLNWYFLSTLPVASAFCSVFCGMFLGTEYSDGTMRNKLYRDSSTSFLSGHFFNYGFYGIEGIVTCVSTLHLGKISLYLIYLLRLKSALLKVPLPIGGNNKIWLFPHQLS